MTKVSKLCYNAKVKLMAGGGEREKTKKTRKQKIKVKKRRKKVVSGVAILRLDNGAKRSFAALVKIVIVI